MRNERWHPRGDQTRRDSKVSKEELDRRWELAFGKKDKKVEESEDQTEATEEKEEK